MRKTVSATTLGCKVNQYDTDAMLALFRKAGYHVLPWGEPSDIALVNTCTVTATADKKSRNLIRQAAARGSRVCVCGCMAQKEGQSLLRFAGVAWIVGTGDRRRIVELVEGDETGAPAQRSAFEELEISSPEERTRGFIKIQEGCSNWCSYCVIPSVRGKPQSRKAYDVIAETRRLVASGAREIVLTGINLSSYGDEGTDLADLVLRIERETSLERLRLGSLEPGIFTEDVARRMSESQILCPSFHVSLQSGSSKILEAMNRRYTPGEYLEEIDRLRRHFDDPAIMTDVITGFPGETREDHLQTRRFIEEAAFSRIHVFPYSERPGTKAAEMPNQVPKKMRREEAAELIDLGRKLAAEFIQRQVGKTVIVLFEESQDGIAFGYSEKYVRVSAPHGEPGRIEAVFLERSGPDELIGYIK